MTAEFPKPTSAWKLRWASKNPVLLVLVMTLNLPHFCACIVLAEPPDRPERGASQSTQSAADKQIRQLIDKLAGPSFTQREQAMAELIRLGPPARQELQRATKHTSREVRFRAGHVLKLIQSMDLEQRLQAFRKDPSGADHQLPGWTLFRRLTGNSAPARRIFADMQRDEPTLLAAFAEDPKRASAVATTRIIRVQQQLQIDPAVNLGTITALLFVAGDARIQLLEQHDQMIGNLCNYPAFREATAADPRKEPLLRVLARWVRQARGNSAYVAFRHAIQYELPEGVPVAERVLKAPGQQSYVRQMAVLTLAKLGGPQHTAVLEALLTDRTVISTLQINRTQKRVTQLRDVALVSLVKLNNQDFADFHLAGVKENKAFGFDTRTLGFFSESEREKAIAKWREFRKP